MIGVAMLSLGDAVKGSVLSMSSLRGLTPLRIGWKPVRGVVRFAKHVLRRRGGLGSSKGRGGVWEMTGLLLRCPLSRLGAWWLVRGVELA